jgi:hypothetical protein
VYAYANDARAVTLRWRTSRAVCCVLCAVCCVLLDRHTPLAVYTTRRPIAAAHTSYGGRI